MIFKYAVTFESGGPIETARGEVEATAWHTAAARAIKAARKQIPGKHATSIVVLLENRV